jgi:hypothetical protein
MRRLALILLLLLPICLTAEEPEPTNYFCVVCGKGPLSGSIWLSKWGAICDDCNKLERRCSICGLPIRDGDDCLKTGDGRYICRFDKPHTVMDAAGAREIFAAVRRELVGILGSRFRLNNPDVTVNVFDVDYWSENVHTDGLHKFGFSSSRKTGPNEFTHEVVLLSGRLDSELAATAAHEYTHLWINENLPPEHVLAHDTVEGLCELVSYKLVDSRADAEQKKVILANPYTHGETAKLVEVEQQFGMNFILNWVVNGAGDHLNPGEIMAGGFRPAQTAHPFSKSRAVTNSPPQLPTSIKLGGLILGPAPEALINGVPFLTGDLKTIKLKDSSVQIHCLKITDTGVVLRLDGNPEAVSLKVGEEKTGL